MTPFKNLTVCLALIPLLAGTEAFCRDTPSKKSMKKPEPAAVQTQEPPAPAQKEPEVKDLPPALLRMNKNLLRPRHEVYRFNRPEDLIELVPILRDINRMIPRSFNLADHRVNLNSDRITIRHEFQTVRSRAAVKNSIISLSYQGGLGQNLESNVDVPLFYSSFWGFSDWERYPMGNYTMSITRGDYSISERLYIRAQTRF